VLLRPDKIRDVWAVPVAHFQPVNGVQTATCTPDPSVLQTVEESRGRFGLATRVQFNGKPYFVIGQYVAR
jgi:hypothetical protein